MIGPTYLLHHFHVEEMNKTPTKRTSIYLHLTHLHVSVLSDHPQGALVKEDLDIKMCLSNEQSLYIYVE